MVTLEIKDVIDYVSQNIGSFHNARLERIKTIKLTDILRKKNPYLFRAKDILLAQDLVEILLNSYLSSQEETIFGNFLERLAIFINGKVYNGWKSSTKGIDLEFNHNSTRYIITIKSGPNWGNSGQIRNMRDDFLKAKQTIRTSDSKLHVIAINGCCYGRNTKADRGDYYKYCGQKFWEFISGNTNLYLEIIKPLGYSAKEKNEEFKEESAKLINKFTSEFSEKFVTNGAIDWDILVKFNSAEKTPKL